MKKLFTALFILSAFYSISSAQQDPGTIQFGVNGGLNQSYVDISNSYQQSASKIDSPAGFLQIIISLTPGALSFGLLMTKKAGEMVTLM